MAHVPCLSPEPALGCWYRKYSEDEDELLPLYHRSATLKPKTEGSLRRRLLSAKIHQKQDFLWTPKPLAAPPLSCPHCLLSCYRPSCNPMHPYPDRTAVSNLDEESRWTVHYAAPWRQQGDVFLPRTRPACVDDLHHQAKVNLKTVLQECDKLRKDGFHNSHYISQGPSLSTTNLSDCATKDQEEDKKSAASSAEENLEFPPRPQTPLERGSDWPGSDEDVQMGCSRTLPLPTPEERMRQQALTFAAHIIPINVTGEMFDQQASARRSIVSTDTMVRQPKNITRKQTITGVSHDIKEEPVVKGQSKFHAHSMYVPSLRSVTSALCSSQTRDSSCQMEDERMGEDEEEEERMDEAEEEMEDERTGKGMVPPSMRRIRAHRGQGTMANISAFSSSNDSTGIDCIAEPRFHSIPSQRPYVSLQTDPCYTISPCCLEDLPAGTLLCQMTQLHGVMIGAQESEREQAGNGRGCPHALPSAPPIPNTLPTKAHSSSDRTLAMVGVTLNTPQPYHNSASSLSDSPSETDSQCITCSESDQSDTSSTITANQWTYDTLPNSHLSSSCSSPVNHHSPELADSCSLCYVGSDGGFSSIGLRSHSYSSIGASLVRHSVYQCHEHRSHGDRASLCSSISLRKAKTPPQPPTRTDSLRNFKLCLSELQPGLRETELDLSKPQLNLSEPQPNLSEPQPGLSETELDLSESQLGLSDPQLGLIEIKLDLIEPQPGQSELQPGLIEIELDLSKPQLNLSEPQPNLSEVQPDLIEMELGRSEPKLSLSEPEAGYSGTLIASLQLRSSGSWSPSLSASHEDSPSPATTSQTPGSGLLSEFQWKVPVTEVTTVTVVASNSSSMSLQQPQGIGMLVHPVMASSPSREQLLTTLSSDYSSQSHVFPAGTPMGHHPRARGRDKPRVPKRNSSLLCATLPSNPPPLPLPTLPTPPPVPHPSKRPSTPILLTAPPSVPTSPLPPPLSEMSPPLQLKGLKDTCDADETVSEQRPAPYQSLTPRITTCTLQMVQLRPVTIAPAVSLHQEAGQQLSLKPEMADTPADSPADMFTDSPVDTPTNSPVHRPTDSPVHTPTNSPLNTHTNSFVDTPTDSPVDTTTDSPVHTHTNSPVDTPTFSPVDTTTDSPVHTHTNSPVDTPTFSPVDTTTDSPVHTHTNSPVDTPTDSPAHTHTNSPVDTPTDSPVHTPTDSPVDMPTNSPVDTPTDSPVDMLIKPEIPSVAALDSCPSSGESSAKTQTAQFFPSVVIAGVPLCSTNLSLMNNHSGSHQDLDAGVSAELCTNAGGQGSPPQLDTELDSESRGFMLLGHSTESLSSECSTGSLEDLQLPELIIEEPELFPYPSRPASNTGRDGSRETDQDEDGDGGIDGDGSSPSSGTDSISSKEEENGDVFEDMLEDLLILTPPRTTEDLFAAIHRSKRKVLGRRESKEERVHRYSFSPPATPTGSLPGVSSLLHLRRCASSCDSFKALLLRKWSRPVNTSRMSAVEMLRCSAPCFQRAQSESSLALPSLRHLPYSFCSAHAGRELWAGSLFLTEKQGRPCTPPSAASSRYSSQGRVNRQPYGELSQIPEHRPLEETRPFPNIAAPGLWQTRPFHLLLPQGSDSSGKMGCP